VYTEVGVRLSYMWKLPQVRQCDWISMPARLKQHALGRLRLGWKGRGVRGQGQMLAHYRTRRHDAYRQT
jgi:hypothetical protein